MKDGAAPESSGWWPDPTGRFDQRYAIRGDWTSRVRVGDAEAIDPRPVEGPPDGPADDVRPAATATDDAGWHDDPTGRFDQRWWDGERWTRRIRHHEAVATDATAAPRVRGRRRPAPPRADQPPPPGWLPDPDGQGERFWDGRGWTAKRRTAPRPSRRSRAGWSWWSRPALATVAVVLLATVALVAATLSVVWPFGG